MRDRLAPGLAAGAMALTLILAGCTSPANQALPHEVQRLTAENERLAAAGRAQEQKLRDLAQRNQQLEAEMQILGQELQRQREHAQQLKAELADRAGKAARIPASLVEPRYAEIPGGTDGWTYRKLLEADLDGDEVVERVVVTTSAFVDPVTGQVGWDDGHPWQVYVEEPDGARTLLFARWVQLGRLEVLLGEQPAGLIIQQETGVANGLYQVTYRGPGQVDAVELIEVLIRDRAGFPPGLAVEE